MELILRTGKKTISSSSDLRELGLVDFLGRVRTGNYVKSIEYLFIREIVNGLKKSVFVSMSKDRDVQNIADFLNVNYLKMFKSVYEYGAVAVKIVNNEIVLIPKPQILKNDTVMTIKAHSYRISEEMELIGTPMKNLLKSYINDIAECLFRDAQVSKNLGLLGIICKERAENMASGEIERVEKKLNSRNDDFFGLIASNQALRYLKIDLPLDKLDLAGRVISKIRLACSIVGVPYILIDSGSVTYENQAEAYSRFYDSTIKGYAEIFLELGREIIRKNKKLMISSEDLTYIIEGEINRIHN